MSTRKRELQNWFFVTILSLTTLAPITAHAITAACGPKFDQPQAPVIATPTAPVAETVVALSPEQILNNIVTRVREANVSERIPELLNEYRYLEVLWVLHQSGRDDLRDELQQGITMIITTTAHTHRRRIPGDGRLAYELTFPGNIRTLYRPNLSDEAAARFSEEDAYRISHILGIDVVPLTVNRTFENWRSHRSGSLQLFVEPQSHGLFAYESNTETLNYFDYLVWNIGRMINENSVDVHGRFASNDHGYAFLQQGHVPEELAEPTIPLGVEYLQVTPELRPFARALRDRLTPEVIHQLLDSRQSPEAIEQLILRRQQILNRLAPLLNPRAVR